MNTNQPSPADAAAPSPRLDVIGLVTGDMAASLAFYRLLGLDVPPAADGAPHVEVTLPGGLRVLWDTEETIRSFDPEWTRPSGGERVALAFRCADPAQVDTVHDRLVAAGHRSHLKPWDAVWGQRYAVVLDPDGTGVSLYADAS
ncbi:VOC family protein [Streptomyces sp. NPDC090025]|uniref:VOC family protein n=1 Tax=Streptomyces sp. NPDC090025 TaxID=3365922 RepID=UPI0038377F30